MRATLLFALAALPTLALAQETAEPRVRYAERTEITFTDVDVLGELAAPSIHLVSELRDRGFPVAIELRTSFDREMAASLSEVQ